MLALYKQTDNEQDDKTSQVTDDQQTQEGIDLQFYNNKKQDGHRQQEDRNQRETCDHDRDLTVTGSVRLDQAVCFYPVIIESR